MGYSHWVMFNPNKFNKGTMKKINIIPKKIS